MACGRVDVLFLFFYLFIYLFFFMLHYIAGLLHFLIYQASVLSAVECLVCFSESTLHFPFNCYSVIFPLGYMGECSICMIFFLLYSGGLQIICSSDIIIAEHLSIASGCDHSRNTRLDLVFVLQFTVRQNLLMSFLDPGFHHC